LINEKEKKMARFEDYRTEPEVRDIVEQYVKRFPTIFEGFKVDDIFFIMTEKKKLRGKFPIKVKSVTYPHYVYGGYTYVFETYETKWEKFTQKKKNLAVFHAMCAIPVGGFDPQGSYYGKLVKPDYEVYALEYAASGGIPDWYENDDSARDPMEIEPEEAKTMVGDEDPIPATEVPDGKSPVTIDDLAEAGMPEQAAAAS
jgi:hypothetical protein